MDEQRYLLDNQVAAAGERFAALASCSTLRRTVISTRSA